MGHSRNGTLHPNHSLCKTFQCSGILSKIVANLANLVMKQFYDGAWSESLFLSLTFDFKGSLFYYKFKMDAFMKLLVAETMPAILSEKTSMQCIKQIEV